MAPTIDIRFIVDKRLALGPSTPKTMYQFMLGIRNPEQVKTRVCLVTLSTITAQNDRNLVVSDTLVKGEQ